MVAAFLMVITMLAALLLQFGWVATSTERTQSSADLAAISGAQVLLDTRDEVRACEAARAVVSERVIECGVNGYRVSVRVVAESRFNWIAESVEATAAAEPAW